MSKKPSFREPFDKQHGKRAQALLKCASQHLYQSYWSLPSQLSWKTSLLLTRKILGLLVKTLAADEKYPVLNRDNLTIPIQMELSQQKKPFLNFLLHFWNEEKISNNLKQMMTLIDFVFPKLRPPKMLWDKCLKSPVSEDPSTSNMVNMPKRSWNQHHNTFSILIDNCQVNWVRKSLSYWLAKYWAGDEMYPVLNRDNLTIPIQMQFPQKKKPFLKFSLNFWNLD